MSTLSSLHRLALLAFLGTLAFSIRSEAASNTLMRYPTMHGDTVVFVAHDNLWSVPRSGGTAARLTADEGRDLMPRFSPDGKWIAFTGEYQGNRDVYVIPARGGEAQRLTFTSDVEDEAPLRWGPNNMVVTWTPDSKSVVFLSRREAWNSWFGRLFSVPLSGGLPVALPLDRGGFISYSPDGGKIAYNRIFRNFRTWKRYQGGLAQDIDVYDFATRQLTHLTDWPGTETSPMWYGRTIYFLSDHDERRRANIWACDTESHQFREVTQFTDYDVDFPSLGQGGDTKAGIVFQQGGHLFVLDLPSETLHRLEVSVPDDGTRTGPRWVDASQLIRDADAAQQTDFDLAPNGKRAVFSARGDLFTVPAEHGNTRNLTESSNADEDHPAWSPDGKTIAYTTDASGEQQLAVRPAEGGAEKVLTRFDRGFVYSPVWAPGGDRLAFSDHEHRLWLVPATGGEPVQVAQDPYSEVHDYSWSPDGRWVAYSLTGANQQRGIWLYEVATRKATRVSEAFANDFDPVFDPRGRYLYFVSTRHENPTLSESEFDVAALKSTGIYVTTLTHDTPSPFAPRSDEGAIATGKAQAGARPEREDTGEAERDKAAKKEQEEWKPGASQPIKVELEGLMARAVPLPIPAADISGLQVRDDRVFYSTSPSQTIEGPLPGEKPALHVYDMKERKDALVVEGPSAFVVSADGKKVLYKKEKSYLIADARAADDPEAKDEKGAKTLDLSHLRVRVLPTQEWAEIFANAWRLERDFFFNPKMNDVDWPAVRGAYAKLLPLAGSRGDVNYLIGEMLGELSNSHTYVGGGDALPDDKKVPTAFLGADLALDPASGRYRLATVYPGDNTRSAYRAPLTAPGLGVKSGQYLLAIDGVELQAPTDPGSLLVGKQDRTVKLTLADSPGGARRDVVVQPVKNELSLREQAWIDHNRQQVEAASGGRIGYIYLSDMSGLGMEQFIRQFYPQLDKQALIVDDRWNGGGFIDQVVLERLRRILVGMTTNRERMPFTVPSQLIRGPKVCLINHYSASDGDIFPFYFRKDGLGPLIGTRTWGGVRGIRGEWLLLDGGYVTVPEDSLYGLDSQWVMENHGVDPDLLVDDSPADWAAGHDVQLEAAIKYLLEQLEKQPQALPPPPPLSPAYPPAGR
ncbi:MAG TPA: S41 family peptidase [Vicinamibacteria bacterium]|nr:S41 family peptidase [Vicinamibacteria bacterium]